MLLVVFVSVVAPFIKIDVTNRWTENTVIDIDERIINAVTIGPTTQAEQIEYIPVITESAPVKAPINYQILVYKIGLLVFTSILLIQLSRLAILIISGKRYYQDRFMIIEHQSVKAPSSFLFAILLPNDHSLTEREKEIIIEHERQHIQQSHSLDLLAVSLFQILTWYNPFLFWIRSEFKNIHEALADKATLETVGNKEYFQLLLASAFSTKSISLSHCFGQKKGLLKRIQLIKKQQTTMKRTAISLTIFTLLATVAIGVNVLSAQDAKAGDSKLQRIEKIFSKDIKELTSRERNEYMINIRAKEEGFPLVNSREEALEIFKRKHANNNGAMYITNDLTTHFKTKLARIQGIYSGKEISWKYIQSSSDTEYTSGFKRTISPLYVGKLSAEDKDELVDLALKNKSSQGFRYFSSTYPVYFFSLNEVEEELRNSVRNNVNYVLFFEYLEDLDQKIYNEKQVDALPEPIGGLKAFERAIALDVTIPEGIDSSKLPETIDISAVISGGKQIHSVNVLTKVKGADKTNESLYKFYGSIIKDIQEKTRTFYSWKSGLKDGKEVKVRMKISIPTKYMM